MGDLLFSLSLKPSIILPGKVCPFSQMSTSFLIFSYARGEEILVSFYTPEKGGLRSACEA